MRQRLARVDAWLLSFSGPAKGIVIAVTLALMAIVAVHEIPRPFIDFSRWPLLSRISQPEGFGTDTIADAYEARVVRHDVRDMYTKRLTDQTPREAETWTKDASSPYPPATLLALAGLAAVGDACGVGLYGAVFALAVAFLGLSLIYCLQTRWYLFPLLYVNFAYVGERFFRVQDGSYLVMLAIVLAALFAARRFPSVAHVLMAAAIVTKLSPFYFVRYLTRMPRSIAIVFLAILVGGFVLPYFIWDNYLYIFRYNSELKGSGMAALGAGALAIAFVALLERAAARCRFDLEDIIGWSLVPMALFLAFKMNVIRHVILVLLVPDKRVVRNLAAAIGLGIYALLPSGTALNSMLPVVTAVLIAGLALQRDRH
jgi:hypothetical protein